jgi:hypothetical protein
MVEARSVTVAGRDATGEGTSQHSFVKMKRLAEAPSVRPQPTFDHQGDRALMLTIFYSRSPAPILERFQS